MPQLIDSESQGVKRWMTRREASEYANTSLSKLDKLIRAGDLPASRDGGLVRIDRLDIDRYYAELKARPNVKTAPRRKSVTTA